MNSDLEMFRTTIKLAEQMLALTTEMNQNFNKRAVGLENGYKALKLDIARMKVLFEVEAELDKMEQTNLDMEKQITETIEQLDRNALLFLKTYPDSKEREEVLKAAYNGHRTLERSKEELSRLRRSSERLLTEMLAV